MYNGKITDPLLPGRKIALRGEEFVIPSLTLADAEALDEAMETAIATTNVSAKARFTAIVEVVGRAIRANYPELTDYKLRSLLDFENHVPAYLAAIGRDAPDPNAPARRPTAETLAQSNGMTSTAS